MTLSNMGCLACFLPRKPREGRETERSGSSRMIFISTDLPSPYLAFIGILHLSDERHAHFLQHPIGGVCLGQRVSDDSAHLFVRERVSNHSPGRLGCPSAIPILGSDFISDLDRPRVARWTFESSAPNKHSVLRLEKKVATPVRLKEIVGVGFIGREGKGFREVRPAIRHRDL